MERITSILEGNPPSVVHLHACEAILQYEA